MLEDDQQAITDLTRMAFFYIQRGDLDKAAELMALAEQIERRMQKQTPPTSSRLQRKQSPG